MARDLTAGIIAELTKAGAKPVVFVQAEFSGGTINVWNGIGSITWDSKTWTGLGRFGSIAAITETTEVRAEGVVLTLSGIPADLLGKALDEVRPDKPVSVWFGFLDANGAVIADPYLAFKGKTDFAELDEGGESSTIRLHCESRLVDLNRSRERRWTHEDQQLLYPGDLGFQYVVSLQDWNGVWGKAGPSGAVAPTPGTPAGPRHGPYEGL